MKEVFEYLTKNKLYMSIDYGHGDEYNIYLSMTPSDRKEAIQGFYFPASVEVLDAVIKLHKLIYTSEIYHYREGE